MLIFWEKLIFGFRRFEQTTRHPWAPDFVGILWCYHNLGESNIPGIANDLKKVVKGNFWIILHHTIPWSSFEKVFKPWYSFIIYQSSFIGFCCDFLDSTFFNVEGGKVVRKRGNHYSSDVSIDLIWHKDVINQRRRGVVYTSRPSDDREQTVGKHWLQISICQIMLCKIQNVNIKVRQNLNFAIFVIFTCHQLLYYFVVGGNG